MKRIKYIFLLLLLNQFCELPPLYAENASWTAEQLRWKLESYINSKSKLEAIWLFETNAIADESRESPTLREITIKHQIASMRYFSNSTVKLLPLPQDFPVLWTNQSSGEVTKYNLPIIGLCEITNQAGGQVLPYGADSGRFFLAGISHSQLPGKRLSVQVQAGPNSDVLTYTGRWTYFKNGNETAVLTNNKTNKFLAVWGDYIRSCEIRRTSTNEVNGISSWFHFRVSEGGKIIFDSPDLTNDDLFFYQRK